MWFNQKIWQDGWHYKLLKDWWTLFKVLRHNNYENRRSLSNNQNNSTHLPLSIAIEAQVSQRGRWLAQLHRLWCISIPISFSLVLLEIVLGFFFPSLFCGFLWGSWDSSDWNEKKSLVLSGYDEGVYRITRIFLKILLGIFFLQILLVIHKSTIWQELGHHILPSEIWLKELVFHLLRFPIG